MPTLLMLVLSALQDKVTVDSPLIRRVTVQGEVTAVAFTPDGKGAVAATSLGAVAVFEFPSGRRVREFRLDASGQRPVLLSLDGARALAGVHGEGVGVWDVATGRRLRVLAGPATEFTLSYASPLAISPDGKRVAAQTLLGIARVWDAETGRTLYDLPRPAGLPSETHLSALDFSPDGARLLVGASPPHVRLFDAETGKELVAANLRDPGLFAPPVSSSGEDRSCTRPAVFLPDGKSLLLGLDTCPSFRRLSMSGVSLGGFDLAQKKGVVLAAAFSPDGRRLLTSQSPFGGLSLTEVETGTLLGQVDPSPAAMSLTFSPDGRYALSGENGKLAFWSFPAAK